MPDLVVGKRVFAKPVDEHNNCSAQRPVCRAMNTGVGPDVLDQQKHALVDETALQRGADNNGAGRFRARHCSAVSESEVGIRGWRYRPPPQEAEQWLM